MFIKVTKNNEHRDFFSQQSPAPQCPTYGVGLTGEEKKLIVDKHNELRAKVASGNEPQGSPGPQPAAKNMQNLVSIFLAYR